MPRLGKMIPYFRKKPFDGDMSATGKTVIMDEIHGEGKGG
jgi:hypothetical protein